MEKHRCDFALALTSTLSSRIYILFVVTRQGKRGICEALTCIVVDYTLSKHPMKVCGLIRLIRQPSTPIATSAALASFTSSVMVPRDNERGHFDSFDCLECSHLFLS
ncbi:hypothetical protein ECG_08429 [Echinococcus granulosus]|nr:hypothetical protein ECG_08429 [Echinococcus granulosus]